MVKQAPTDINDILSESIEMVAGIVESASIMNKVVASMQPLLWKLQTCQCGSDHDQGRLEMLEHIHTMLVSHVDFCKKNVDACKRYLNEQTAARREN